LAELEPLPETLKVSSVAVALTIYLSLVNLASLISHEVPVYKMAISIADIIIFACTGHRTAFAGCPGETGSLRSESIGTNQDHLRTHHKGN